jgi:hypothetical protein
MDVLTTQTLSGVHTGIEMAGTLAFAGMEDGALTCLLSLV